MEFKRRLKKRKFNGKIEFQSKFMAFLVIIIGFLATVTANVGVEDGVSEWIF